VKTPERVLIVHPGPQFSVEDVYRGWYEAFCDLGIQTIDYNLQDRLLFYQHAFLYTGKEDEHGAKEFRKAFPGNRDVIGVAANQIYSTCYRWWPDLILIISAFFIPEDTIDVLRSRGHKVVILFTESPYEEPKQVRRAGHADLVLVNDPSRLDLYDATATPALYMPHAYRPALHYPGPGTTGMDTDFAFVGTSFPSRVEFFEKMHSLGAFDRIDVTFGGFWGGLAADSPLRPYIAHDLDECLDNDQTAGIYRAAKVGVNFYRRHEGDAYSDGVSIGPREIEMAACGLVFLRDPRPESDELFGSILPAFHSPEEATEQLRWWLSHDDEREQAGLKLRAAVRPRTFRANALRLLQLLDDM
jgi:hypothetical protein